MTKISAIAVMTSLVIGLPASATADTDSDRAAADISWAWNDYGPCSRLLLCATYFDEFGVSINFANGTVVPFAHIQRLSSSAHDCVVNAKAALQTGDKGLAVGWIIATQLHNNPEKDWLKLHPDAVVAALKKLTI